MIYIDSINAEKILKHSFADLIDILKETVFMKKNGDVHQPLKPYLKFRDPLNRIIAMPAYVGGNVNACGIKWIASFPKNIENGIPRANSVTILNSTETGVPYCIIDTVLQSVYRTASVTGMIMDKFIKANGKKQYNIGIIGYGPIGRLHEEMCYELFDEYINKINIADRHKIIDDPQDKTFFSEQLENYDELDILITCTSSLTPYLDHFPKNARLVLNISLRDFEVNKICIDGYQTVIDDWIEVAREKTNVESLYKLGKLTKEDTIDIYDYLAVDDKEMLKGSYFFNPMGLAVFDVAVGEYMYRKGKEEKLFKVI